MAVFWAIGNATLLVNRLPIFPSPDMNRKLKATTPDICDSIFVPESLHSKLSHLNSALNCTTVCFSGHQKVFARNIFVSLNMPYIIDNRVELCNNVKVWSFI